MKTRTAKSTEIKRDWYIIDATNIRLGKLATKSAELLIGKSKVNYSSNFDNGDYVVIINSKNLSVYPKKLENKYYYNHSGYMGGMKKVALKDMLAKFPNRVVEHAVSGMLPKNKLRDQMLKRLYIYEGEKHPHEAQTPKVVEIN